MTVLEFPQAAGSPPRIADSKTERQASDFCDLEGPLCDVVTMASIAAQIATNTRTDDGDLVFAVYHVSEMLDAFKVKYYAAYNGVTTIEP